RGARGRTRPTTRRARAAPVPPTRWAHTRAPAAGYLRRARSAPDAGIGRLRLVRIGLALPQYDYSVAGEQPLRWETVAGYATRAEQLGYESLWLSDHLFLDLARYGGSAARFGVFDPLVSLAALARTVARP